ncbi:hypothetical protein EV368DRAFT_90018 [Lentinula lateritia]|nr:hypothetical protein EV368DRAFT_90018 [Lentinula lateritia]
MSLAPILGSGLQAALHTTLKQASGPPVVKNTPGSHNYTAHAKDKVPQRASVFNKFLQDNISDRAVLSLDNFATPGCKVVVPIGPWHGSPLLELTKNTKLSKYLTKKITGVFWGLLLFFVEVKHKKEHFIGLNISQEETGMPRNVSSGSVTSKTLKHESMQASKTAPGSSQLNPLNSRSIKWPRPVEELETDEGQISFDFTVGVTDVEKIPKISSLYRVQSEPLPSIRHLGSVSMPPASATTSFGDEDRPQVTIHQSGGKEKTLEVGSSQEYALRAEEELKEERFLTPTRGQHQTRIQYASYAKEMLSDGLIRNHVIEILADDDGFRFDYYDRSKSQFDV